MRRIPAATSAVGVIALLVAGGASVAAAQTRETSVEEIVITAQKREQPLQAAPLAVQVLPGALLRGAGAVDIKSIQVLTPGLTVTSTTSEASTTARIRGVGTVGDNPGLEPSVGVVIDGVYRPRNGVALGELGELDRVEVLKGPQGAVFGKSTSAGVINILTAAPSSEFHAAGELTAGNYEAWGASADVTGPLSDHADARLFVARRTRDGFQTVSRGVGPRTETRDMNQDLWTGRAQLLLRMNSDVTLRLIADMTRRDEDCCQAVQILTGTSPVSRAVLVNRVQPNGVANPADPFARVAYANRSSQNKVLDEGLSAQADIDLGGPTLTSTTALRRWSNKRGIDWDFTAADIYYRPTSQYKDLFSTFSEEVRLSGEAGMLTWMAGGFFLHETYEGASPIIYGNDYYNYAAIQLLSGAPAMIGATSANTFTPGSGQRDQFEQRATTWALFTNNTLDLTSAWDVTGGVRYTEDKKRLDSQLTTTGGSCGRALAAYPALLSALGAARAGPVVGNLCLPWENELLDASSGRQSATERNWSGSVKSSYRLSSELMGYVSYSRGYKAGGYNFDRPAASVVFSPTGATLRVSPTTHFAPETVDAFEIGAKTRWFERRLTVNVAAFHQAYEDFQLNLFLGTSFVVESIPRLRSKGVEMDLNLKTPVTGLNLSGGVTYAQTEYGAFTASQLADPTRFAGLSRLPGARASFSPLWSVAGAASYETPVGGSGLVASGQLSAKYNSDYNTGSDLAPQKIQQAFAILNARLGLAAERRGWSVEAWASNLTKARYIQAAFNAPLQGGESDPLAIRTYNAFLGSPRTYGLTLHLRR